ncbi:Spc98 family-domain-containing protein [Parasitella parasitica]|nr:Spc98 family-domain-containing protein [Parasitella parasitica]
MFEHNSIDDEHNGTLGFMQWYTQQQLQQKKNEKAIVDLNWFHPQLRLQPLSEQPFDFFDANASIASSTTDSSSTDTLFLQQQQHLQPHQPPQPQEQDLEMEGEEQDIWLLEATMRPPTTFNTLSWDTRNSQFPSYEQTRLSDRNIGTPFITEAPLCLFEPLIRQLQDPSETAVIYESELAKSLIQAITGLPSIYFYWDQQDSAFRQRMAKYRILGVSTAAIQPLLEQVLLFGTHIRALEYVSQQCQSQPDTYGLTGVAFGCCLQELLMYIQHAVMTLFASDQQHDFQTMTVLKVHHSVQSLTAVVEKLHGFCQVRSRQFVLPKGASLLNLLHRETSGFDLASNGGNSALYRDVCLVILSYTSVPYSNMMSNWLHLNSTYSPDQHGDPYAEFFIGERVSENQSDLLQRYKIRSEADLPYFVDKKLALYILRSGISVRLLKLAKPDHPLFDLDDSINLKFILNSTENEEYTSKLQHICNQIKSYNSLGNVHHASDEQDSHNNDDADDDLQAMQHDTPTLPPLDTKQSGFAQRLLRLLQDETRHSIPTLDTTTRQSYIEPIQTWCPLLNESFMISFLDQFKLQSHLSLLYRYFLFGNGVFVNGLKATLFSSSSIGLNHMGNCWPPKSFDLTLALRNLLLENAVHTHDDLVTFSFRKTTANSQWNHPHAVEALNFLQLNYDATYPLNMVITPAILDKYNRIFSFLLQLLRVATVIKRCYEPLRDMKWHRQSTRDLLFKYRFQMDQFTSALQSYIHDTAIKASWSSFMQHVQAMQAQKTSASANSSKDYVSVIMEPHSFRDYHEHVLDRILFQCFLKQSQTRIFQVLQPVLEDIIFFSAILDDYTVKDIENEDKLSLKCRRIFEQFQKHTQVFVKVLQLLETKGSGRLTNILNSTRHSIFNELYTRHEAKHGMDVFVRDLLTRLVLNGYYL